MRVALIATEKLPVPPVRGGAIQLYIDGILPYLTSHHDVTVFSVNDEQLPAESELAGAKVVRLLDTRYHQNVAEALRQAEFELLHIFNRPTWVVEFAAARPEARRIVSLHNEMFESDKISAENAAACLEATDKVVTVSRFIAEGVAARYPQAAPKTRVVYSGVDPEIYLPRWHPRARQLRVKLARRLGFDPDAPIVLNVGRLSPKKGSHLIIQAMDTVHERFPEAVLIIVGSKWYGETEWDEYGQYLMRMAARSPGRIFLTGFVPPGEIPAYYSSADVFVCASQWPEPLARVHYEAMAAGLPIITTRRGGNPEVVDGLGNGWVVDEYNDPVALGTHIALLLEKRELAEEMGRRGRELAEERFNWKRVADELLEIYAELEHAEPEGEGQP
ncbi:MAG: glycosyltransferase family 4 protein [Limnochordales bacterium]|nr:glycosyltransferase family 4 protein [Limnochordales bacterium]